MREKVPAQDQQMPKNGLWLNVVIHTSFKVDGIDPHGLKMDQQLQAAALSHGPVIRFATLCAVAAAKFDLTGTP